MRRFSTPLRFTRLVIATHNPGKLREFAAMLDAHIKDANVKDAYVKNVVSAGELGLPEPEETGTTFAENAILKAQAAAKASGSIALADDSGLCVTALNGDPGIYSARWGGPNKDFAAAMQRVHDALGDASPDKTGDRSAYFICVLALAGPDGELELFEGRLDGAIIWPPRGDQGHGYDPFFVPTGHDKTCAEMDSAEKNAISHRGIALRKLLARLSHA